MTIQINDLETSLEVINDSELEQIVGGSSFYIGGGQQQQQQQQQQQAGFGLGGYAPYPTSPGFPSVSYGGYGSLLGLGISSNLNS